MRKERSPAHGELLTVRQAAERLCLKESTVRAWLAQRRFTFVKLGRAIRISSNEVERHIANGTVPYQAALN